MNENFLKLNYSYVRQQQMSVDFKQNKNVLGLPLAMVRIFGLG